MATPVEVTSGAYSEAQRSVEVYKQIMLGGVSVEGELVVPAVVPESNFADIEAATDSLVGTILSTLNSAAPTALSLTNGWVNYGGQYGTASCRRDLSGNVILSGLIKDGTTTAGTVIAILPEGFRPSGTELFQVNSSSANARVDVNADGEILIVSGGSGHLSLAGIVFYAGG